MRAFSAASPSTFGIDALVRINQMGASVFDVAADWHSLWILVAVYAVAAFLLSRLGGPEEKPA